MLRPSDVDVIRATNNKIFDDIFWVHLVYATDENGIERLRALLRDHPHCVPVLAGFEAIEQGDRVLQDAIGATTSFDVPDLQQAFSYFSSFYLHLLVRGLPHAMGVRRWPRITRFEDRWHRLVTSVVPRFRRLEGERRLLDISLRRIADEAHTYAPMPCVRPLAAPTE